MTEAKTNDAIKRFKAFLREHPEIVTHVHENDKRWRDVFDDWVIFGESHEIWTNYGVKIKKQTESGAGQGMSLGKIMGVVDRIDTKQWQERLNTISGALAGIQQLIGQFRQDARGDGEAQDQSEPNSSADSRPMSHQEPPGSHGPFFF